MPQFVSFESYRWGSYVFPIIDPHFVGFWAALADPKDLENVETLFQTLTKLTLEKEGMCYLISQDDAGVYQLSPLGVHELILGRPTIIARVST